MLLSMVDDILAVTRCSKELLEVNTFINAQIEIEKLRFHTPDITGNQGVRGYP